MLVRQGIATMYDIPGMIKQVAALWLTFRDGNNQEKMFHIALRKDLRKAVNLAEDIFDLVDEYMDDKMSKGKFSKKYKSMKKKFNDLD